MSASLFAQRLGWLFWRGNVMLFTIHTSGTTPSTGAQINNSKETPLYPGFALQWLDTLDLRVPARVCNAPDVIISE